MGEVVLKNVSLLGLQLTPVSIIPPKLYTHIHSFNIDNMYLNLASESVIHP